jgi:biotin operon repressor/DNA-binding transcriptional ArsR family regulator
VTSINGSAKRVLQYLTDADGIRTSDEIADAVGLSPSRVRAYVCALRDVGIDISGTGNGYRLRGDVSGIALDDVELESGADTGETDPAGPDQRDSSASEPEPEPEPEIADLTDREEYLARQLRTSASVSELAADIGEPESVIRRRIKTLEDKGWSVYRDAEAGLVELEGEHTLRSAEHKGTRTRKANRWWELRHSELVKQWKRLDAPVSSQSAVGGGSEDWVLHMTDLHAGDEVRDSRGEVVYRTDDISAIVDYVTERSLALADKHNSDYDRGVLCWGGDFFTGEGIYDGQFEDLDAWLDEQMSALLSPLRRQIEAFSGRFDELYVGAIPGNHGEMRASGTSRQANADLLLYKALRNQLAALQDHGRLTNVSMKIAQGTPYLNIPLRGGHLTGHLRHGQNRRPQAETSARKKEWLSTLHEHEFDMAWMGHHHVSGRIPWSGPPVIVSGSPKPVGEFVRRIGESSETEPRDIATAHGISDKGITSVWPIDTRHFTADDRGAHQ